MILAADNGSSNLLRWCQRSTTIYDNVEISNFTTSFADGLAFCALVHAHDPKALDFKSCDPGNALENLEKAFSAAEKLGVNRLLDPEDIAGQQEIDQKSVMMYVSEMYHVFTGK